MFITGCNKGGDVSGLYSEGSRAFQEKHFEQAEITFKSVIEADDDFLNAYLMLAKIYYYKKDYNNSILVLEELIKRDRDHAGALYWKPGSCYVRSGEKVESMPLKRG
jgi:tetratricopeptide (TPR) repeat protein